MHMYILLAVPLCNVFALISISTAAPNAALAIAMVAKSVQHIDWKNSQLIYLYHCTLHHSAHL